MTQSSSLCLIPFCQRRTPWQCFQCWVPSAWTGRGRLRGEWQRWPCQPPSSPSPRGWRQAIATLVVGAKNNPAAVVGQERVTACHTGGSGSSGCHQRAVITLGLIIWGQCKQTTWQCEDDIVFTAPAFVLHPCWCWHQFCWRLICSGLKVQFTVLV